MSKILIVAYFLLIWATNSRGQTLFGLKAGLNRNEIVVENAPFLPLLLYRPNIGFHAGMFAILPSSKFSFNPELLFVQRGANSHIYLQGSLQPATDSRINLNYIELPLLFSLFRHKAISFETGPNVSMRLSAKEISDNGKTNVSNRFNKLFDFGINLGITVNIGSGISMVARYCNFLRSRLIPSQPVL